MAEKDCPLCTHSAGYERDGDRGIGYYDCRWCGEYGITDEAKEDDIATFRRRNQLINIVYLSAFTRNRTERRKLPQYRQDRRPVMVTSLKYVPTDAGLNAIGIDDILADAPRTIAERVERTVVTLFYMTEYPGAWLNISVEDAFLAYAPNQDALQFLLSHLEAQAYIEVNQGIKFPCTLRLTPNGWDRAINLEAGRLNQQSVQGFVAMWFDASMDAAYERGLAAGISNAGYKPFKVNDAEYNDKIDDRIIAEIRKSRFIVADVTEHRQGVYFEAGFAMGLGLPVIWTCKRDYMDKCHFDTRQYNHIVWDTEEELCDKLRARIEATIGRPPSP